MKKNHLKFYKEPKLQSPSLVISWSEDAAQLGPKVVEFLIKKLGGEMFCEIEPLAFFPLGEVEIRDDLIQFPESEFFACKNQNLIIFKSYAPRYEWYDFLNLTLDVAEHCGVKEFYSIGGMVSLAAHTNPRRVLAVFNKAELRETLAGYGLNTDMDFRTPPGGRPTLSSFLLWIAKRRNIGGANLWVETPFYLATNEDSRARKTAIEFLDKRFDLAIDLSEVNQQIQEQEEKINQLRTEKPEIDGYIKKLERSEPLTHDEGEKLVKEMDELFKRSL